MSQVVQHIEIVRKKEPVVERGPKVPQKQKVIVLRKVHKGEDYTKKEEIPVSIGIPQYYEDLQKIEEERKRREEEFRHKTIIYITSGYLCEREKIVEKLHEDFDLGSIKTDPLIKAESEKDTKLGQHISHCISEKKTIPVEIVVALIKQEIMKQGKQYFLIDDFPMREDVLQFIEERVCPCKVCFDLTISEESVIAKLTAKAQEEAREPEAPEVIKERMDEFNAPTAPLVDYLYSRNKVMNVDANREFEEIYADIKKKVLEYVPLLVEEHPEEEQQQPPESPQPAEGN